MTNSVRKVALLTRLGADLGVPPPHSGPKLQTELGLKAADSGLNHKRLRFSV